MATRQFESVEEIDGHYKRQLAKADEEQMSGIREEWLNAKNDFLSEQLAATTLRQARMDAVIQFPDVAEWRDELQGTTPEEVQAHAKRIHDRLEAMKPAAPPEPSPEEAARAAYGNPGAAGNAAPIDTTPETEQLKQRVWGKLQRGEGMQDAASKNDQFAFSSIRIREAFDTARTSPNFKPTGPKGDARRKAG